MITPDVINALFEFGGACAIGLSIRKVLQDKVVRGFHWGHTTFFFLWGIFNMFYYPSLDQWWSTAAGALVCATNAVYLYLLLKYREKPVYSGRVAHKGDDRYYV